MKTLAILAVSILLTSFSLPPKSVKFQYFFKVDDQYDWVQVTNQTIKQSIMGMDQVVENTVKASILLKVSALTSNGAKLEARYVSMSMSMKLPAGMGSQDLDSNGDQEKLENKVMKALTDKPFTITITKQGKIESIDGEENLWSDFSSLGLNNEQLSAMKSTLEQNLSEGSLKTSFQMVLTSYPENPIKPGEQWKNKLGAGSSFPLETENTWSIAKIEGETANLSAIGVTSTTDKTKVVSLPNNIKSTFDLAGEQKVTSAVNVKTAWPTQVTINSEIKGNMNLLAGGMIPTDLAVPMSIVTTSNFTVTKK
ncbi:MAG TPA: DUF6263 family protein [Cyclobacteriaceae bacterium]|nr:DUF6263 family protein [Cyclobacteriaceae bacterium]